MGLWARRGPNSYPASRRFPLRRAQSAHWPETGLCTDQFSRPQHQLLKFCKFAPALGMLFLPPHVHRGGGSAEIWLLSAR